MPLFRRKSTPQDRFTDEIVGLIRELLGVTAQRTGDFALTVPQPGGTPITMNLHTIYAEAQRLSGEERALRLRTAVLAMAPTDRPDTWDDAQPALLPAVRSASWAAAGGPIETVRRPLTDFVQEMVAIDLEHAMTFVTVDDLATWGVDAGDVHRTARQNLLHQPLPVLRDGPVAHVGGPDGYVSSWLAVPAALAPVARDVGDLVVAIAPGRDQLLLADVTDPPTACAVLRQALTDYDADPRSLSPVPYLLHGDRITPWQPDAGHPAAPLVDRARGILATVEYQHQRDRLDDLHARLGEDVFVASHTLMEGPDATVWSWAAWVRQVQDGLLPEVDIVVFADNDHPDATFGVPWADTQRHAGDTLRPEPGYDPPLYRHHRWPEPDVVEQLRAHAVPLDPP